MVIAPGSGPGGSGGTSRQERRELTRYEQGAGQRPFLRRIVITLGPLEEWRGLSKGEVVRFESDGTPNGLKVVCNIQKGLMGSPQPSQISIYNLSQDTRDAIRGGLTKITVEAGWKNTELHKVFQGSVLAATHERNGADIVTKIAALPGYGALVRGVTSKTFGAGTPVRDVVKALAADMPGLVIEDGGIEGVEGTIGPGGWSFAGGTRDGLTQLAVEHGFSWHVDDGAFRAVGDKTSFGGVTVLNGDGGGLISVTPNLTGPLQKENGVKVKAMYVPGVTAGSVIKVNSAITPKLDGDYKVHKISISLDTFAEQWTMDIENQKNPEGGGKGGKGKKKGKKKSKKKKK